MDEPLRDLRAEVLAQRSLMLVLWSTYLGSSSKDPIGTCHDAAAQMRAAINASDNGEPKPGMVNLKHEVLQKLDRFWAGVEEQLLARLEPPS